MPPQIVRRFRIVLVDDDPDILEMFGFMFRGWFSGVEIATFDKPGAALEELERRSPDMLVTGIKMPRMDGYELVERVWAKNTQYPILVLTAYEPARKWVERHAHEGFNIRYHRKPCSVQELPSLRRSMELALKVPDSATEHVDLAAQPSRASPLRIVQVNDEPSVLKLFGILLRKWFPDATLLSFDNGAPALEEISRTEPDLLITDDKMPHMSGEELCRRLLERKVSYPIIVNSPWKPTEEWVREFAWRGLQVSFFPLPCSIEGLRNALTVFGFAIPPQSAEISGQPAPSCKAVTREQQKDAVADQPGNTPSGSGSSAAMPLKGNAAMQQSCKRKLRRIVIMDDEEHVGVALSMMIHKEFSGTEVLTFTNAAEAMDALLEQPPDILTTDWSHPGRMCPTFFRHSLAQETPYPILLISAGSDRIEKEGILREFKEAGLDITLIGKPFRLEDVRLHFDKYLGSSEAGTQE